MNHKCEQLKRLEQINADLRAEAHKWQVKAEIGNKETDDKPKEPEIEPCMCEAEMCVVLDNDDYYYLECSDCLVRTTTYRYKSDLIAGWNVTRWREI